MAVRLMTVSAYARHRNCDEKAVRKAIAENRISFQQGAGGRRLVDPEVADIQWARNTRARVALGSGNGHHAVGDLLHDGTAGAGAADTSSAASTRTSAPAGTTPSANEQSGYTAARVRTEMANAQLAELELARKRAEVRDVADITRGGFDVARELRDAMDSSVNTLATELASLASADACARVLRQHNRTIQQLLAQRLREKLGVKVEP